MRRLRVAVDIDGVIANQIPAFLEIIYKKYGKKATYDEITDYSFEKSLGLPTGADCQIIKQFNQHYLPCLDEIPHSISALKRIALVADVVILSNRTGSRIHTRRWLDERGVSNKRLAFTSASAKSQFCIQNSVDVLIEDSGETAITAAREGIDVILFDAPWNSRFTHKKIARVVGWVNAYGFLLKHRSIRRIMQQIDNELVKHAHRVMKHSYAPYSHFQVGACLLTTSGYFATGTNVENASLSLTTCAERSAIYNAVSEGRLNQGELFAVGITAKRARGKDFISAAPCGACLQVISEFSHGLFPTRIVIQGRGCTEHFSLDQLLPRPFECLR